MELAYTIWNEKGGITKTTTARDLAVAHARQGKKVLCIDLDEQGSTLTDRFGYGDLKHKDIHTICENIAGMPTAVNAEQLIRPVEDPGFADFEGSVDLIPTHDQMQNVERTINKNSDASESLGPSDSQYDYDSNLFEALNAANVGEEYDVLIIDTKPAKGPLLRNALYVTRNLLVPVTYDQEGLESTQGLGAIIDFYKQDISVDLSTLGALPTKVHNNDNVGNQIKDQLEEEDINVLDFEVKFLRKLFKESSAEHKSAYAVAEGRDRPLDRELEVLDTYDNLAAYLMGEDPTGDGKAAAPADD